VERDGESGFEDSVYGVIALLSWRFGFYTEGVERPIIAVLSLFAATFGIYLIAIASVKRLRLDSQSTKIIVGAAILFRVVMLFSLPIQEVDLYRYLWDGAVCCEGVSPFAFSPTVIQKADTASLDDQRLARLIRMLDREPAMAEILDRVHFPELPTIYPPTSQAVFAAVSLTTPSHSPLLARVFIIKAWLIGFDIATPLVVIALLRLAGKPIQWCVINAWCPLLMKEVANGGHLDAIAVFLTTFAVYLLALSLSSRRSLFTSLASFVLALAVGANVGIACVGSIIALTADAMQDVMNRCIEAGCNDCLSELIQCGAIGPSGQATHTGPYTISTDTVIKRVKKFAGYKIELQPIEADNYRVQHFLTL